MFFQDAKCACGDGGLVHPWECCSTVGCNMFCCACEGPCRKKNETFVFWDRVKREIEADSNELEQVIILIKLVMGIVGNFICYFSLDGIALPPC